MAIRMGTFYPGGHFLPAGATLSDGSDELIRSPLWHFAPQDRKAVIHERRVRFGVYDDEGLDIG